MEEGFNKDNTLVCKGIAIILMVVHHLFWNVPDIGVSINGIAVSQRIGVIGKVCVSVFIMLSGLGLYKGTKGKIKIKEFYVKRLSKLYLNYLFIVITSSLIGLCFFKDIFLSSFPNHRVLRFLLNCTGFQYVVGYQGINSSWWFVTEIMICYILYPLLLELVEKYKWKFAILTFILSFVELIHIGNITSIIAWICPFVIGITIAADNTLDKIKNYVNEKGIPYIAILSLLLLVCFIRQIGAKDNVYMFKLDYILSFVLMITVYLGYGKVKTLDKFFVYFGKKSMDIFYVHMFIGNYFLKDFTYSLGNPILMCLFVMVCSLIWSYLLDFIRKVISFDTGVKRFQNKICKLKS
ncbi:MAG: acyltransferase [Clostridium sp.]|nr:acyltransferase [Clostridium sp.]